MNDVKNIIAVETSSDICGISFISDGICLKTIQEKSERKHIEKIPLFYKRLQESIGFELSDVSAIAVSIGPGSFTGLRIGLSFSKGLAFSNNLPMIPVSTMMSLAFSCKSKKPEVGIIHSHGEKIFCQKIYWKSNFPEPVDEIRAMTWSDFLAEYDSSKKTFQKNCDALLTTEDLIAAELSSENVGVLAYFKFDDLVMTEPHNLVSNYVSPFIINKNK
jgi:tRNA threonylcarbamoyl adenosine modification protein YeaZ